MLAIDTALDSATTDLIRRAFDRSWQFVGNDPQLAHADRGELRERLSRHLIDLAQNGDRDVLRLANTAIGELRRERHTL